MKTCFAAIGLLFCPLLWGQQSDPLSPHEAHLPVETIAAFSILDSKQWQTDWRSTGLAKYFAEPAIAEFFRSVTSSAESDNDWLKLFESLNADRALAGQATIAVVEHEKKAELIVVLDFQNAEAARRTMDQLELEFKHRKWKSSESTVEADALTTFLDEGSNRKRITCCVRDRQLLVGTHMEPLSEMLSSRGNALRQSPKFTATVLQSTNDCQPAMFWWYLNPLGIFEFVEESRDEGSLRSLEIARTERLDTIEAIGGVGSLRQQDLGLFLSGQILAKPPYQRSMRLLEFAETEIPETPKWFCNSTSGGYLNLRMESFLNSFSTLFDAVVGEGEEGVFEAVLEDLNSAPNGPKINLQNELMAHLKSPVCFSIDASAKSSASIFGIQCRDHAKVKAAVEGMFTGDSRAEQVRGIEYPAWNVLPLEGNPAGMQDPFVVAIRNGFLIFALDCAAIDRAFYSGNETALRFRPKGELALKTTTFGFVADLRSVAEKRHGQLRSGTLDGWLKSLLERLKLTDSLTKADRSGLPEFSAVGKYFDAELHLFGSANGHGWKIIGVID